MSFLLRRNRPLAYSGWYDDFNRADEDPIKQPWGANGGFATAKVRLKNNALEQDAGYLAPLGAVSYEFQPFTKNWGFEFNLLALAGGLGAQQFQVFLGGSWAKQEGGFVNSSALQFFYRTGGLTNIFGIYEFKDIVTVGRALQQNNLPGGSAWWYNAHNIRGWVDDDRHVRVWIDGKLWAAGSFKGAHVMSEGRRAVNFNNQLLTTSQIDTYKLYDRPTDLLWTPVLYEDNFNRPNNASLGADWAKLGRTGTAIATNSLAYTSTADNPSWANNVNPMPTPDCRIATIVGGHRAPVNAENYMRYQRINARINPGRTNFISAWWSREKMALVRGKVQMNNTAYPSNGWDLIDDQENGSYPILDGDEIALCLKGNDAWIEHNGDMRMGADITGLTDLSNDRGWGLGLDRANFASSGSFDNVTYQSAT